MIKREIALLIIMLNCISAFSQTDTTFWFAAPEVTYQGGATVNYDRPIMLRLTTYQQAAIVKISQPANGGLPTQTLNIPANSTQSFDLTPWIDSIECKPANLIQNRGIKIISSTIISAYYEVVSNGNSPEIFVLKGKNSLGNEFYISSQSILSNSVGYTPIPYSSFNIVATEDNTIVNIKPTNNIVGHLANTQFSITLNKGQTYAAIASSQSASQHLGGSYVTSNKPIAITLSDDLLYGIVFGGCGDLAGDQTIPTSVIGNEYIAIKGNLNNPYDKVYVTATQNGTSINKDGVFVTTLNAGQTTELTISNSSAYIKTSFPSYAYQLSGIGCEVGAAILPPVNCTGSNAISITRSTLNSLYVTILVKTGGQSNFLVNDVSGVITAAQFSVVPGTANQWQTAKVLLPLANYPNGSVITIKNTNSIFHLGVLQGNARGGASFGYFSDFGNIKARAFTTTSNPCVGTSIKLFADTINSASYNWTGPNGFTSNLQNPMINSAALANLGIYKVNVSVPSCGNYIDSISININTRTFSVINQAICEGQSYLGYSTTGIFNDTLINSNGCDSIRTLKLTVNSKTFSIINQSICAGQSYLGHNATGTYIDTITNSNGCDSIRTLNLTVSSKITTTINKIICQGQSYLSHNTTGVYIDTFITVAGCDSIRILNLTVNPRTYSTVNKIICEGQSYLGHNTTGTYIDTITNSNGCDSIRTLKLTVNPKTFSVINKSICAGQSYLGYSTTGIFNDTLINSNGCDSIRTLNLTVNPKTISIINQSICAGQSYLGHKATGTYIDTITNSNGCDSIRTLNLYVVQPTSSIHNVTICIGQDQWGYTNNGTFKDTLVNSNGCDSIRTLNLIVNSRTYSIVNQSICEGQSYLGYSTNGTFIDTFVAANGCDSIRTLNLIVNPRTYSTVNQTICKGQTYLRYNTNGTFIDTFVAANGCDSIRTLKLIVLDKPNPNLGNDREICIGDSIILFPGQFLSYLWQDGTIKNHMVIYKAGTYSVTVTNSCGLKKDEVIITEKNCDIYFPSAFTPNNDGRNDVFKALNAFNIKEYHLTIYNRWGQKVFETTDFNNGWNGKLKGIEQDPGVYVWLCKYSKNGIHKVQNGTMVLLR